MTQARAAKIAGIANDIPLQTMALGEDHGHLAVVGWGSTYGAIHQAVRRARNDGVDASHIDRKSTRLNSSHGYISYAVFCLKKKKKQKIQGSREHRHMT